MAVAAAARALALSLGARVARDRGKDAMQSGASARVCVRGGGGGARRGRGAQGAEAELQVGKERLRRAEGRRWAGGGWRRDSEGERGERNHNEKNSQAKCHAAYKTNCKPDAA